MVPSCCEGQGSAGRREHTGSAGNEAPSVQKMRAEMTTQTHQQPQRERECHITMPHTHTHKTQEGIEKAKGGWNGR